MLQECYFKNFSFRILPLVLMISTLIGCNNTGSNGNPSNNSNLTDKVSAVSTSDLESTDVSYGDQDIKNLVDYYQTGYYCSPFKITIDYIAGTYDIVDPSYIPNWNLNGGTKCHAILGNVTDFGDFISSGFNTSKFHITMDKDFWDNANSYNAIINHRHFFQDDDYSQVVRDQTLTDFFSEVAYGDSIDFAGITVAHPSISKDVFGVANDDRLWWAWGLATNYGYGSDHTSALSQAGKIFNKAAKSWTDTCGGGIVWDDAKDSMYKNAINNELFITTAMQIYSDTKEQKWLDWAKKDADWFLNSGMINSNNLINDGLTSSCQNNNQTTWSYNQGVILPGLAQLSAATNEDKYINKASEIVNAALSSSNGGLLDANGILQEQGPYTSTSSLFKGAFVRGLTGYIISAGAQNKKRDDINKICAFAIKNADTAWKTKNGYNIGYNWDGSNNVNYNSDTTGSAIDLFNLVQACRAWVQPGGEYIAKCKNVTYENGKLDTDSCSGLSVHHKLVYKDTCQPGSDVDVKIDNAENEAILTCHAYNNALREIANKSPGNWINSCYPIDVDYSTSSSFDYGENCSIGNPRRAYCIKNIEAQCQERNDEYHVSNQNPNSLSDNCRTNGQYTLVNQDGHLDCGSNTHDKMTPPEGSYKNQCKSIEYQDGLLTADSCGGKSLNNDLNYLEVCAPNSTVSVSMLDNKAALHCDTPNVGLTALEQLSKFEWYKTCFVQDIDLNHSSTDCAGDNSYKNPSCITGIKAACVETDNTLRTSNQNPNSTSDKCVVSGKYTLDNIDGHLNCLGDLPSPSQAPAGEYRSKCTGVSYNNGILSAASCDGKSLVSDLNFYGVCNPTSTVSVASTSTGAALKCDKLSGMLLGIVDNSPGNWSSTCSVQNISLSDSSSFEGMNCSSNNKNSHCVNNIKAICQQNTGDMRISNQNPNSSSDKCFVDFKYTLENQDGHLNCIGNGDSTTPPKGSYNNVCTNIQYVKGVLKANQCYGNNVASSLNYLQVCAVGSSVSVRTIGKKAILTCDSYRANLQNIIAKSPYGWYQSCFPQGLSYYSGWIGAANCDPGFSRDIVGECISNIDAQCLQSDGTPRESNQNPNSSSDKCVVNGKYTLENQNGHLNCIGK